jgi:hypothetical protein
MMTTSWLWAAAFLIRIVFVADVIGADVLKL